MDSFAALHAFSALSQPTRLAVFRLLIRSGSQGMLAGEIARALNVRQNTMSANLTILLNSQLVVNKRQGRAIRYFADFERIRGLLAFLMEDCCGGKPSLCQPVIDAVACHPMESENVG